MVSHNYCQFVFEDSIMNREGPIVKIRYLQNQKDYSVTSLMTLLQFSSKWKNEFCSHQGKNAIFSTQSVRYHKTKSSGFFAPPV